MRFAVALLTLLIAGVLVAAGLAQRTIWKPSDHVSVAAAVPADVRYVVVPGSVLTSHAGGQALHLAGNGTTFAAYGKTADITAWLAGERYAELRVDASGTAMKPVVRTAPAVAGLTGGGTPDPDGSDLWMDQRRTQQELDWPVNLPSNVSMIIAADGAQAAPSSVSVSWAVRTATPFAVPMVIAGGALAVVGLLLYIWALVHVRRRRGPRRKPPAKMPRRPPPPKYRPHQPVSVAPPPGRGRRSVRHRVAVGASALTVLLLGGAALVPGAATAAPTPATASVTEAQAIMIARRVAEVAAKADTTLNAATAAERFGGVALELRTAAYRIKKKDKKADLPLAVPLTDPEVKLTVPQATTSWPRTLFMVIKHKKDDRIAPIALAMVQNDPRSDYIVQYAMGLQRDATVPDMPSALTGAARLTPDATVLRVQPEDLADEYGLLLRHADAPSATTFKTADDDLLAQVGEAAKKKIAKQLGGTGKLTFTDLKSDPASVIAMSTADSGALVAVQLDEQWTAKPKRSGVRIASSGGTKILTKKSSSATGFASVYGYQLLFSVPSAGSDEPVVLLGYAQGLVSAKEL